MSEYPAASPTRARLEDLRSCLRSSVSLARYEHVLRTVAVTCELCRDYDIATSRGTICALGHDLCREWAEAGLLACAARDGAPIDAWEARSPLLLHGRSAAVVLRERFGVEDEAVLDAVRWHTTGRPGMGDLAKILFISDYVEPGREHVEAAFRRRVAQMTLNEAVLAIIDDTVRYLVSIGREPAASTVALKAEIERERSPA